jgi:hypothetical protein
MGSPGLGVLFALLTCAFAGISVDAALAGRWVITFAAAALAFWMGTFVLQVLRKTRR